jgi:hypothetical protein
LAKRDLDIGARAEKSSGGFAAACEQERYLLQREPRTSQAGLTEEIPPAAVMRKVTLYDERGALRLSLSLKVAFFDLPGAIVPSLKQRAPRTAFREAPAQSLVLEAGDLPRFLTVIR